MMHNRFYKNKEDKKCLNKTMPLTEIKARLVKGKDENGIPIENLHNLLALIEYRLKKQAEDDPFERQLQRKRKKFVIKKFGYGNKKDIGGNIIKKYNNYHYGGEDESTTIYRRRKANSNQMGKSISKT